jgi:hypothetical protein
MSKKPLPPELSPPDSEQPESGQKTLTRRDFVKIASAVAAVGAGVGLPAILQAAGKKTKIDTPTVSCATGSSAVSINISVCAGATGLPAGFSIQWMTAADYALYGWPANSDCPLDIAGNPTCPASFCKASFSGNANLSRYNLPAFQCVTVNLGEFLFDEGASTNCDRALVCGTEYVFRAFGHATSALNRSDFTANFTCSTIACSTGGGCTFTQGYWKTHNDTVCLINPSSPLCVLWPVTSLTLGTVSYTQLELLAIFGSPASGNGLISLAHQLIAAKLNIANGSDPTVVAACVAAADALIGNLVVPPVGSGSLAPSTTSSLTGCLTSYNEGATGPGHCD